MRSWVHFGMDQDNNPLQFGPMIIQSAMSTERIAFWRAHQHIMGDRKKRRTFCVNLVLQTVPSTHPIVPVKDSKLLGQKSTIYIEFTTIICSGTICNKNGE